VPSRRQEQVRTSRVALITRLVCCVAWAVTLRGREQGDALYCTALLHDNLDNREHANALYIKCARAAAAAPVLRCAHDAQGTTTFACSLRWSAGRRWRSTASASTSSSAVTCSLQTRCSR
jgi:hypothetical protein